MYGKVMAYGKQVLDPLGQRLSSVPCCSRPPCSVPRGEGEHRADTPTGTLYLLPPTLPWPTLPGLCCLPPF